MKILRVFLSVYDAFIAGAQIQLAGESAGLSQVIHFATAIFFAALCIVQINKLMEDE